MTLGLRPVAARLKLPTFVTSAGDGSGRLFVVEQAGTIRIVRNGALLVPPFLDISALTQADGERGLLGLTFHPQYRDNGRLFIAYTARNGDITIAAYQVSTADANRADPSSARVVLSVPHARYANHNGGMIAFGPDGYLYAAIGDGGSEGDPHQTGQDLGTLLAKLLRLDVDHGSPYAIPPDNPFVGRSGVRPEIWAYGLRNAWRFSFDRATGDLWIADVGQDTYEELDYAPVGSGGGQNYGWSRMEGTHCYPTDNGRCDTSGLTLPMFDYPHTLGCAVTGGYVYRGSSYPPLTGAYLYADYCSGRIWALSQGADGAWTATQLLRQTAAFTAFGEDEAGDVYLVDQKSGSLFEVTATPR